jgi:hypothetical protein
LSTPPPEKERRGRRRREAGGVGGCSPRRPEPLVGGAGPAVVKGAYFLCFNIATTLSSSFSPTSRAALLHRRLHYGLWPPR